MNSSKKKVRFGTCSKDCYGSCVFKGEWDDSAPEHKFLSAIPLKDHPFTQGIFCKKLNGRNDLIYLPKRLKKALIRTQAGSKRSDRGNDLKPVGLQYALDIISKKIKSTAEKHGSDSILGAYYSGNSGLISRNAPLRFFGRLNATVTKDGICNEGGNAGLNKLFGTYSTMNPTQLNNARLIVVWGCNLSETNNHAYLLIKKALKNGAKLVVIDCRNTKIAEDAHLFLQIFPLTDYLLVKMVLHYLIIRSEYDSSFLIKHVNGFKSVFAEVNHIDENEIFSRTGINKTSLQHFLELLVKFKHQTVFNIGYGVQKNFYGGNIIKTIALIQIFLGSIGKSGSGIIYSQSEFVKPFIQPIIDYITKKTLFPPLKEISLIKLGTELASNKYKMLFIFNLNPLTSLPNLSQLRKSISRDDLFVVVHELFLNETTAYADVVIPAKFDIETNDIITPYFFPSISITQAGPCPYSDCLSNHEFFQQLAWKMGWGKEKIFAENDELIFQKCILMLPLNIRKDLLENGYHAIFESNDIPYEDLCFPTPNNLIDVSGP
ncbi:MAG: molybdopterin-dependent oxidoreductase, partial [Promethearchaeota archaeon]